MKRRDFLKGALGLFAAAAVHDVFAKKLKRGVAEQVKDAVGLAKQLNKVHPGKWDFSVFRQFAVSHDFKTETVGAFRAVEKELLNVFKKDLGKVEDVINRINVSLLKGDAPDSDSIARAITRIDNPVLQEELVAYTGRAGQALKEWGQEGGAGRPYPAGNDDGWARVQWGADLLTFARQLGKDGVSAVNQAAEKFRKFVASEFDALLKSTAPASKPPKPFINGPTFVA